ncbi:MAG: hypothetical protein Q4C64_02300 [Erysipelotrichia bacterium]|nr:hypothetical protein [Erysipelotrichia bacterium]
MLQDKSLENRPLGNSNSLDTTSLNDKKVKFIVVCNHSIYKKDLYFHNYVNIKSGSMLIDKIMEILELDRNMISYSAIPIEQVKESSGLVRLNNRMRAILEEYNYKTNGDLLKCSPKTELMHKLPKDTLRFIVDLKGSEWIIALIDPWHLFATAKSKMMFEKYKCKRRYDINQLKRKN